MAPAKIARLLAEKKTILDQWETEVDNLKPGWSRPWATG